MKWYTANAGDQGLIIDEETGRNVAVSYDKKDAELIASSPDLLEELKTMIFIFDRDLGKGTIGRTCCDDAIRVIIDAEGMDY